MRAAVDDPGMHERIERLRRRVAWQVATAYCLELEDVKVPDVREAPAPVLPLPVPAPAPPPPEPAPEPPPAAARAALPTLDELERAVAAYAEPDRVEELRWYLFYLRDHAEVDGTLPESFGLLVDTVFGTLPWLTLVA